MRIFLLLCLIQFGVGAASAQLTIERPEGHKLWIASVSTLALANTLDIHSSWGKRELNPLLASSSGRFGQEGALIKLGLQGGLMGLEYLITRGHPSGKTYKILSIFNFGASASLTSIAFRNYTVPRSR